MINFIIEANTLTNLKHIYIYIPDFPRLVIKSPRSSNMAAIKGFFIVSKIEAMKKRKRKLMSVVLQCKHLRR